MRAFALLVFVATALPGAEYVIAPGEGNRLALAVYKTGLMRGKKHDFVFERYRGKLAYDEQQPEASQVELVIEAASIVLRDEWLSEKDFKKVQDYALKEMLAAAQHREIRFQSRAVRAAGPDQFDMDGTLTIRGIAKPVTVHVTRKAGPAFEGTARINMTDYKLKPPSAALGLVGTRDVMDFSFLLAPTKAP